MSERWRRMSLSSKLAVCFIAYVLAGVPSMLFVGVLVLGNTPASASPAVALFFGLLVAPIVTLPLSILALEVNGWHKKRKAGGKAPPEGPSPNAILDIGAAESQKGKPVFAYSSTGGVATSVLFGVFFTFVAVYAWVASGSLAVLPTIVLLLTAYDLGRWWHRPLKKARFYDDHLEISGWKVKRSAGYNELERIVKPEPRKLLGEVIGNEKVWFLIRGDPRNFEVPNMKRGVPGVELYQWLSAKNLGPGRASPIRVRRASGGNASS